MRTLKATFKIVTPLFMSGSDQTIAELRPPSLKGVIRFWWRALAYSRLDGNVEELSRQEAALFGSTEQVSSILIRISTTRKQAMTEVETVHPILKNLPGARYLGYGLMDAFDGTNTTAGKLQRPCISHGQTFEVKFISKSEIPEDLINAVKLSGLLGGMGSRARKGFGSLALNALFLEEEPIWTNPSSLTAYKDALSDLLGGMGNMTEEPVFSAFSQLTRIDYLLSGNDPTQLLDDFGRQMQRYRSWGHNNKVNYEASEQNFQEDHDWYRRIGRYRQTDFHPERIIFGLPHNYSKYDNDNITGVTHDRRASPLLVHVHEFSPNQYGLISIVLRSEFLPAEERINAGNRDVTQNIDWEILDNFLDGVIGKKGEKTLTPYFPNKQTWFGGRINHDQ